MNNKMSRMFGAERESIEISGNDLLAGKILAANVMHAEASGGTVSAELAEQWAAKWDNLSTMEIKTYGGDVVAQGIFGTPTPEPEECSGWWSYPADES